MGDWAVGVLVNTRRKLGTPTLALCVLLPAGVSGCHDTDAIQSSAPSHSSESSDVPLTSEAAAAAHAPMIDRPTPASTWNANESGLVMHGYDPVSYHDGDAPQKGKDALIHSWDGVHWSFSSRQNLERFKKNPERYAPAVGGFCTFGVLINKKFDGDPLVWTKRADKVHLFLNEEVKAKFLQHQAGNWHKVSSNWPKLSNPAHSEQ